MAALVGAIRARDLDAVIRCLDDDPSLLGRHDPAAFGATPLIHAVGTGDRTMVDLLLDRGAAIDQRSDWWAGSFGVLDHCSDAMATHLLARGATLTPHAAARLGMEPALRAMLEASPAIVQEPGGDGQRPLHFARTVGIADLLLDHGAEIDALDRDHESTPAQWMVGRESVAARLVARGCAVDPFLAARIGDLPLLERLVATEPDGVDVRIGDRRFPTTPPAAKHIYVYTIGDRCTLMHAAARCNAAASIERLGALGADPNARGGYDQGTPLHQAAWQDAPASIDALLAAGADRDTLSGPMHDNEPLGWAIVSGAEHAVRALLSHGATPRSVHVEDARAGVRGQFRALNPDRPHAAWTRIAELVGA